MKRLEIDTLSEIDFAINDVILFPTEINGFIAVTPSPRGSKANVYRKHIQKNRKRMYSAFVELVREHKAGMIAMLDHGKANKTDCMYVPAHDCERAVKEAFTKSTGKLLWKLAKPAIEEFRWPDKVPVLAMSTLNEAPSFFFVHDFSESKKTKGKGFAAF